VPQQYSRLTADHSRVVHSPPRTWVRSRPARRCAISLISLNISSLVGCSRLYPSAPRVFALFAGRLWVGCSRLGRLYASFAAGNLEVHCDLGPCQGKREADRRAPRRNPPRSPRDGCFPAHVGEKHQYQPCDRGPTYIKALRKKFSQKQSLRPIQRRTVPQGGLLFSTRPPGASSSADHGPPTAVGASQCCNRSASLPILQSLHHPQHPPRRNYSTST
jgi:hypothetical protein